MYIFNANNANTSLVLVKLKCRNVNADISLVTEYIHIVVLVLLLYSAPLDYFYQSKKSTLTSPHNIKYRVLHERQ